MSLKIKLLVMTLVTFLMSCKSTQYTLNTTSIPVCEEFYVDGMLTHKHYLLSIENVTIKNKQNETK